MDTEKLMVAEVRRNLAANDRPRVPVGLDLYWKWFADLTRCRTWSMAGPDPISYRDIEAYGRVFGWDFEPKHVRILSAMDDAYLAHFREKQGKPGDKGHSANSASPMTSALFDAMFS